VEVVLVVGDDSSDFAASGALIPLFYAARPTLRSIMLHYSISGGALSSQLWERDMVSNQWSQTQEGPDIGTLWERSLADVLKCS
jgi:hypothetical protein